MERRTLKKGKEQTDKEGQDYHDEDGHELHRLNTQTPIAHFFQCLEDAKMLIKMGKILDRQPFCSLCGKSESGSTLVCTEFQSMLQLSSQASRSIVVMKQERLGLSNFLYKIELVFLKT